MAKIGGQKVKNFSKIAKQLIGLTLALLLFFYMASTALAYDSRYLDTAYWKQEQSCITIPVNKSGAQGDLTGSIEYFTRDESVYFLFDLCENPSYGSSFFFEFSSESYAFSVDENGIFNMADSEIEGKYFDIASSFSTDSIGHGICIIVMDINDKIYTHHFNIYANINGNRYKIANELEIITYPPPQTTKPEKTTTQKQTTTKVIKETTTKTTTERTTKFKYIAQSENTTNIQSETEDNSEGYHDASSNQKTKALTKRQFILTSIGVASACIGALIIGLSLARPSHKKKPRPKTEQDSDEDISESDTPPTDNTDNYDF